MAIRIEAVAFAGVRRRRLTEARDTVLAAAFVDLPCADAAAVLAASSSQIGKPHDWLSVLGIGLHRDWQAEDARFCSELVAWSFAQAGAPLFCPENLRRVTPQHLWMLPYEARFIETPDALQPA